ncbi:nucleoside-diphosphate-sugar epimerase [Tritrichomonas foetus]|uniref:Nucleoside-diphosphate-sugar epimerase n=1 Tax=Tritrichomonas foetus TaxID=1144522 RepID=A0A1J4KZF2_9EUKA|nr:nucleoside-diphosphate-sugar epimerase [Tritrichomonas foetus]|eukprot:OHT14965.1 nucleoside-diphosphate-sugar epimerase [Tritrichomonas foetus]
MKTILLFGISGKQGLASAYKILENGFCVKGVTRNPDNQILADIKSKGASLVTANIDDCNSVISAMENVYGVFYYQPMLQNVDQEFEQAKNVIDAAKSCKISHFTLSTAGGVQRNRKGPHFIILRKIEEYLIESGLKFTIIRPTFFMDNLMRLTQKVGDKLIIPGIAYKDFPIHMISASDIGNYAALSFVKQELENAEIEIAGEAISLENVAKLITKHFNFTCDVKELSDEELPPISNGRWLEKEWYIVDFEYLRSINPNMVSFKEWLENSGWKPV